jgi:spermidine/putrescine transport system ATP-binding protein
MSEDGGIAISLQGVGKRFGDVVAVRETNLDIRDGEFFSMLGPSGCGKTTTLRMIAGFEVPDEGRVLLRGTDVTNAAPNHRNVNTVFQHYALFPHMNVADNVGYGLRQARPKLDKVEIDRRVAETLELVRLPRMGARRTWELSGGQQQRVALARALVNRPAALLLDEPLGALDVKLRKQMQLELKRIQTELGTTFVYVTHDQEEALTMSDRIAVMNGGDIEQVADPKEIYERPLTPFVADFVGSLNAYDLRVDELADGLAVMRVSERERLVVPAGTATKTGDQLRVAVRPERVRIEPTNGRAAEGGSSVEGTVAELVYLGGLTQFHVETSVAGRLVSHRMDDQVAASLEPGKHVTLTWPAEHAYVLAGAVSSEI